MSCIKLVLFYWGGGGAGKFPSLKPETLENQDFEPQNGGLVQMIFIFNYIGDF